MDPKKKTIALDAGESALFERQTTYVQKKTYEIKHREFVAFSIFSVNTEIASGSETVEWTYFDEVGTAKVIADYSSDFPRVDILAKKATAKIRGLGNSYGYTIPEIRRAQRAGVQLETKRASAARKFHDIAHDVIAWKGDANFGLQGFLNYPGTTEVVLAAGASTSKTFALKTPDEIIKDFGALISGVKTLTANRIIPDTICMPQEQYDLLERTRLSANLEKSLLTYLKETFKDITMWKAVYELDKAGAGATDRIYCFNRSADQMEYGMPQAFEQMEPEKNGMEYVTLCHSESAGMMLYYPMAVCWADGI